MIANLKTQLAALESQRDELIQEIPKAKGDELKEMAERAVSANELQPPSVSSEPAPEAPDSPELMDKPEGIPTTKLERQVLKPIREETPNTLLNVSLPLPHHLK